jgi:hypothetical protein
VIGRVLTVAGLVCIAIATLTPRGGTPEGLGLWCVACGAFGGIDVLANIALFAPLSMGLWFWLRRRGRVVAIACLLSICIELLQFTVVPGRYASAGDVMTNTLGALVGTILAERWRDILVPSSRLAARLLGLASIIWLGGLAVSGWAVRPAPPFPRFWAFWRPGPPNFPPYNGELRAFAFDGVPAPTNVLSKPDIYELRSKVPPTRIDATFTTASGETPRLAPIVLVTNGYRDVAVLGQDGRDLLFRLRLNAARLRLRLPSVGVRNAFAPTVPPGSVLTARGEVRESILQLTLTDASGVRGDSVVLTPFLGWSMLLPLNYRFGPEARWFTALWVAGLVIPLGYFGSCAARRNTGATPRRVGWSVTWALIAVVDGLVAAPIVTSTATAGPTEWIAALSGLALGIGGGRLAARRVR